MAVRVGINGFGRIGRNFFRAVRQHSADIEIVAANDLMDPEMAAHLLKYDSVMGVLDAEVKATGDGLTVDSSELRILSERDPAQLPWKDLGVDVVLESTGIFTERDKAAAHLDAGAKKVIISAPAKGPDLTVVMGVNHDDYDPSSHDVLSNASCTTNCVVPLAKVLLDAFGIERGFMTTIHAYTNDQQILDLPHKDPRRARAAALNIIPTSTGAAKASALAIPELEGRLDGLAMRVPVPDGSITDLVCVLGREVSDDEINDAYRQAATSGSLSGVLRYTEDPIVSSDIVGDPHSCVFDAGSTMANGNMAKVVGWYDNEWGFSNRLVELIDHVGSKL